MFLQFQYPDLQLVISSSDVLLDISKPGKNEIFFPQQIQVWKNIYFKIFYYDCSAMCDLSLHTNFFALAAS